MFNKVDRMGDEETKKKKMAAMMVVPTGAVFVTANLRCAEELGNYLSQVNTPTEIRDLGNELLAQAASLRAHIPEDKRYSRSVFNMGYRKRTDGEAGFSKGWFGHPCICLAFSASDADEFRDYIVGLNERVDVPPVIYSFAEQLGNNATLLRRFENGEFRSEKFVHDSGRDEVSDEYLSRVNVD